MLIFSVDHWNKKKEIKVKPLEAATAAKSLQLCPTLSDPMVRSLPGSSIHGIFQARVLEWGAIAFSEPLEATGAFS